MESIGIHYVVLFLFVFDTVQTKSLLNVARNRYETNCSASSELDHFDCLNAFNGDIYTNSQGWRTKFGSSKGEYIIVSFPMEYNFTELRLTADPNTSLPHILQVELESTSKLKYYKLLLEPVYEQQRFTHLIVSGGQSHAIADEAQNIQTMKIRIDGVHGSGYNNTGFANIEALVEYTTVHTIEYNLTECSFPFTHNSVEYSTCAAVRDDAMECKTENGDFGTCVIPVSVCNIDEYTNLLGPPNVEETWCLFQGGCIEDNFEENTTDCFVNIHACPADYFGVDCQSKCNCINPLDGCDPVTGKNHNCTCPSDFVDMGLVCERKRMAVLNFQVEKVNDGQISRVGCAADAVPVPLTSSMRLIRLNDNLNLDHKLVSSTILNTTRVNSYSVEVTKGDVLKCSVIHEHNIIEKIVTVDIFQNPVLTTPPAVVTDGHTGKNRTLVWRTWESSKDTGDEPIVQYIIMKRDPSSPTWNETGNVAHDGSSGYIYALNLLSPGQKYMFSIITERTGPGGRGSMGPTLEINIPELNGNENNNSTSVALIISICIACLVCLLTAGVCAYHFIFRKKQKCKTESFQMVAKENQRKLDELEDKIKETEHQGHATALTCPPETYECIEEFRVEDRKEILLPPSRLPPLPAHEPDDLHDEYEYPAFRASDYPAGEEKPTLADKVYEGVNFKDSALGVNLEEKIYEGVKGMKGIDAKKGNPAGRPNHEEKELDKDDEYTTGNDSPEATIHKPPPGKENTDEYTTGDVIMRMNTLLEMRS